MIGAPRSTSEQAVVDPDQMRRPVMGTMFGFRGGPNAAKFKRAKPSYAEVEREARKHVIAEATLLGTYQR
jgi:hypothetical protein